MLLVMMTTAFRKLTVRPWPSVSLPSSRICSRILNTSVWAFSISSKRSTEEGRRRTAPVRDPVPSRHHFGYVFFFYLFFEHFLLSLELSQPGILLLERLLQLRNRAVAQLCRLLEVCLPFRLLGFRAGFLYLPLGFADAGNGFFLRLPMCLHSRRFLAELSQLCLQGFAPLYGGLVLLFAECLALYLQLLYATLDRIYLHGHGVNLDTKAAGGFVHQVYGLVREEAVAYVTVGEYGRRHQGGVLDAHPVVHFISFFESPQDGDG